MREQVIRTGRVTPVNLPREHTVVAVQAVDRGLAQDEFEGGRRIESLTPERPEKKQAGADDNQTGQHLEFSSWGNAAKVKALQSVVAGVS
jgi:hypothetical protein